MGAEELYVDPLSLDEFGLTLRARLDEALAALVRVDQSLGDAAAPELGGFQDARQTAERYGQLSEQYGARLRQLASSLELAQTATTGIAARFRAAEELNIKNIADVLRPVTERLDHGRPDGR
jgi:hypothetical protein